MTHYQRRKRREAKKSREVPMIVELTEEESRRLDIIAAVQEAVFGGGMFSRGPITFKLTDEEKKMALEFAKGLMEAHRSFHESMGKTLKEVA